MTRLWAKAGRERSQGTPSLKWSSGCQERDKELSLPTQELPGWLQLRGTRGSLYVEQEERVILTKPGSCSKYTNLWLAEFWPNDLLILVLLPKICYLNIKKGILQL